MSDSHQTTERCVSARQADMERGAAAERVRITALLHALLAKKEREIADLRQKIAALERQMAEEMTCLTI